MHRGMIGKMLVASSAPYIVYSAVRGLVSEHRTERAARKSLAADRRGCRLQGGYSDAAILRWTAGGWRQQ